MSCLEPGHVGVAGDRLDQRLRRRRRSCPCWRAPRRGCPAGPRGSSASPGTRGSCCGFSGFTSITPNWSASEIGCRIAATVHGGAARDVLVDHLGEVHAVDVVGADHHHDVGLVVVDQVEGLVDRVGAAEVPVLADPLLRRHRRDVVAEQRRHPPGRGDVTVQGVRLVLRQHDDPQVAAVDDVGQCEVDQPVDPRERHRRLGPVGRQRHQPLALAAGEDDGQDPLAARGTHVGHVSDVGSP